MTVNQMKYFVAVARFLSFTQVAEHLYLTQPALSRQITALESELNMQLLIRDSRHVRLTPAGEVLYEEFRRLLKELSEGLERARNTNMGLAGEIRIGILDGTDVSDFMPSMVQTFQEAYPNIRFSLFNHSFGALSDGLTAGRPAGPDSDAPVSCGRSGGRGL